MSAAPFTVVFAVYPGMTQLDFTGPHQFISRVPGWRVIVASLTGGELSAGDGITFSGTEKLSSVDHCDLICVPGGWTATKVSLDQAFIGEVQRLARDARYITSVCTGSLILGAAGLLIGKRAACHWAWRDMLTLFSAIPDAGRVVRDGNIITGGGVTAGIDFALTIIAEIAGRETAEALQLGLEYAPAPPFDSGSPETAAPELTAGYLSRAPLAERRAEAEQAAANLSASGKAP